MTHQTMLPPGRRTLLLLASLASGPIHAAPTISFPINSQVPPVARISQPFSYVFPSTTFTSSSGSPLLYTLQDPPSWLSIDSDNRRLYGTPLDTDIGAGAVVGVPITLVASDSTGSTPLSVTLVVSRNPGPAVHVPVSDQIQKFGTYSEPSSILLYPDREFLFAFAPDTFIDTQAQSLNYYAVTADNSPLPAWIAFEQGTLAFSGTTPPFASLIEPPQTFSLKLVASDITGFSAASVAFSIVVGSHSLTADQPRIALNATVGTPLSYTGLVGSVKIDSQPATITDVPRTTTENLPPWLVFDPTSWAIAGTPPDTAQSTSFSVIMEDDFSDRLNIKFDVEVAAENGEIFQGIFPIISLEPGDHLSFDLKPFVFDPSKSQVTTDIQPPTPWIEFEASNLLLTGDVPTSASDSTIEVVFNFKAENRRLKRDEMTQSRKLTIQIASTSEPTTTSSAPSKSSTTSSSSAATSSNASATPGDESAHNATTNVVLIAVLVPVILGLLLAICFCFCCYRRRQRRLSRTPLEGKDSCGPEPTNYIHTQGYDPEASRLDLSDQHFVGFASSSAEKSKPRKPSNLRSEYTGSPVPEAPAPALPIIVHDAPTQDALPGKYRELMAPLRNFRIPRLKRGNTRTSNDSFDEDEGRGFSMDHPPSITLRQSRQNSFRSEVEVSIPSLDSERSPLQSPDAAYTGTTARPSGHYYPFPVTPGDRGPPPRNPARVNSELGSRDITPVDQSEIIIEKTRPAADEPKIREHPALRHAKSQKSFLSFSSVDTFRGTRRLAGKATASAKGAASLASAAVQRKTLKAWGKVRLHVQDSPHARQGIFGNVAHSRTDFGHFGGSGGYMSLRDPGAPATVPTPRVATAPVALNSESHRLRQSRMNGSFSSDSRSSRAMSVGAGENRLSRSDPGTVRRRRGSGSYDMPQLPTTSPQGSYMGLGITDYEGLVYSSPFHPSRDRGRPAVRPTTTSWVTTQARHSGSSSMDRPVTAKTAQTAQTFSSMGDSRNWVVHQVSPIESPMENRMESPVLPSPGTGGLQGSAVGTVGDTTPTRTPAARLASASSRQEGGGVGSGYEIKRKSVAQSGKSGTSKESDGPPAFI